MFNDSSNYVPASFDSKKIGNGSINSPIHCVWYFDFMAPQEMNILVSYFDIPHDYNPECTSIRKFIELRSFNESTGMTIQRNRKCARSNYILPENFKIQTSKSFVVTVHSERASSTRERILTVCLPTSPGKKHLDIHSFFPFLVYLVFNLQPATLRCLYLFCLTQSILF